VYQPWTYTADDSTWMEKFLKEIKTGTRILYFVAVGVLALALWGWIAPRRKTVTAKAGGA
jgi:LPXTG-motif cell wall-anchored protein